MGEVNYHPHFTEVFHNHPQLRRQLVACPAVGPSPASSPWGRWSSVTVLR